MYFNNLFQVSNVSAFPKITGCMYEKGPRQFYDDTCVVPEKFDGMLCTYIFCSYIQPYRRSYM